MKSKMFLIIMLILLGGGLLVYYNKYKVTDIEDETLEKDYTFNNEYGEFNIGADKALRCRGTAGSSNNVFYIVGGNLYLYSEASINELYAMNVDDIYYEKEQGDIIVVDTNSDTLIIKESSNLKYLKDEVVDETHKEFSFDIAHGPVTIKADKAIQVKTAEYETEVIYYLKDNNLYHFVIEGEDELYAIGVKDIFFANKSGELISVVLDEGSNIIKESSYLKYVSISLNQFVFDTENGQVVINAHQALACRGSAGASNNIFYMIDGNLYLYSSNKVNTLYAKNIGNIYYENEQSEVITVTTNEDTIIVNESSYLNYEKSINNKKYNEYTFNTAHGIVTINANKALACQGWSGASNTIFFIRDDILYKLMYEGAHEIYAKNVDDIYFETAQTDIMTVLMKDNTEIIKEESFLKYLSNKDVNNENLKEFEFSTAYGKFYIRAEKALSCQGWSGASNTIFYILNNDLYKHVYDGKDELYAKNVEDIYFETVQTDIMSVKINSNTEIIKEEGYLSYK